MTIAGFEIDHNKQLPAGKMLANRYLLQEVLGSGGMGSVYRARDMHFPKAEKILAIKELFTNCQTNEAEVEIIENFEREANILASLEHPSIPTIFDFFTYENRIFLVIDYVNGKDLETSIKEYEGFIPIEIVIKWAVEICDVLEYLHNHIPSPVVFRDLKPSNIMINQDNRIVLIDFGIAKVLQASQRGTVIGTEGYSPPEQYRGEASPQVDIYAFGATLHYLLTRRDPQLEAPFTFEERNIIEINPDVPGEFAEIVCKALAYQPEERYQSIVDMRAEIIDCALQNNIKFNVKPQSPALQSSADEPKLIWKYQCEDEIRGSSAYSNGTIFWGSYDHCLYAVNASDGRLLWKYKTLGGIVGQPLIHHNIVYIGSEDHRLFAISVQSGRLLWAYETGGPIRNSPKFAEEHVFIGSDDGCIHAINALTGNLTWKANMGGSIRSTPLITNRGISFGSENGDFHQLDFGGQMNWRFTAKRAVTSSPSIEGDYLFFTSLDGFFYAISELNGWQEWSFRMEKGSISSPFVAKGKVFFGSADAHIYAVDIATTKAAWKTHLQQQVSGSPQGYKNSLVCGNANGEIYCLSDETGEILWIYQTGGIITGKPQVVDNILFIGSADSNFYALKLVS